MFIDEAMIHVKAGDGGNGAVSFRREKFVPKGGPDGGDGGDGGHVILVVNSNMRTLLHFRHQRTFRAGSGEPGAGKQRFGHGGADCVIPVPSGTVVRLMPGDQPLADLVNPGDSMRVARGGRGGKGNVHFKSPTRRTPRIATDGTPGEERDLRLTLKLLADVGLVGLPNVGKSTLLRRLSNATPKVGNYEFTTLQPNLGIVSLGEYESFVLADLPGLVEGASEGRGLGLRFLKHIERTRLLLFLIDSTASRPAADLATLLRELESFSPGLLRRPRMVVYSRSDLAPGAELPDLDNGPNLRISGASGEGIQELLARVRAELERIGEVEAAWSQDPDPADEGVEPGMAGSALIQDSEDPEGHDLIAESAGPGEEGMTSFFADRVDSGDPLGPYPWPRALVRVIPATGGPGLAGPNRHDSEASEGSGGE